MIYNYIVQQLHLDVMLRDRARARLLQLGIVVRGMP
jgi:hypothetical protein